jgi:tRNA(fMet)-specific endonuclease VapC
MATISISEFGITIVTIHEQFLGSHTYINRARNSEQLVRGYEFMTKLVRDVKIIPVVEFDEKASAIFDNLQHQRIKLVTMDLRIVSIALARGLVLLTRNRQDFIKVPELSIEDWTQP